MSETIEPTPEGKPPLYRIGQVTLSHANRARLDSILGETVREKDSSGTLPERIGRRLARLARWWRYRVKQLEDDGWALTSGNPGRYWSLMRCRPRLGNHTVKQASGACHQAWICPFCWGRDTGRVWNQVKAGFDRRQPGVPYVLLTAQSSQRYATDREAALAMYEHARCKRRSDWVRLCRRTGTRAGGLYEVPRYLPDFEQGGWVVQLRQLFLLPEEAWDRLGREATGLAGGGMRLTRNPKLRDLSNAVSWLARYPRYLLTSPPGTIRALANLRAHSRHPRTKPGALRGIRLRVGLGLFNAQSGRPAGKAGAAARAAALESDPAGAPTVPKTEPMLAPPAALQEAPPEAFNCIATNSPHFRASPAVQPRRRRR